MLYHKSSGIALSVFYTARRWHDHVELGTEICSTELVHLNVACACRVYINSF
jgi:hypothetical protein